MMITGRMRTSTMTICPEAPETIVNLYFVISDLAPGDLLEIFDGPAEPANSFGVFTGGELLALDFFRVRG